MKKNLKIAIVLFSLLQCVFISAQQSRNKAQVDSMLLKAYDNIMLDSLSQGLQLLKESLKISIKNNYREQEAICYNHFSGLYLKIEPKTETALEYLKKSLNIYRELGDYDRIVVSQVNIAYAYKSLNKQKQFDSICNVVLSEMEDEKQWHLFYILHSMIYNADENTKDYVLIDSLSGVFLKTLKTFDFKSEEGKKREPFIRSTLNSVVKIYQGSALIELNKNIEHANDLFNEVLEAMKNNNHFPSLNYKKKLLNLFIYKKTYFTNYNKNNDSLIKYYKKTDSLQSIVLESQEALNLKSYKHAIINFEQKEKMKNIKLLNENNTKLSRLNILVLILIATGLIISSFFIFYYSAANKRINKTLNDKKEIEFKLNSIQKAIASDLHDNFGNRISGILSSSEIVKELIDKKQTGSKQFLKYLGNLNHGVGNLLFDLKDLIWSYEVNNDSIEKLAIRLHKYTSDFSKDNKIEIEHKNHIHDKNKIVPHLWNRQILLTFKEAINNAHKHAKAHCIHTSLNLNESNILEVSIRDNGKGFIEQDVKLSGISNMKKRAESIGCELYIKTISGKGTEIKLVGEIIKN